MRSLTSRCLAAVCPALFVLTSCSVAGDTQQGVTPTDPTFGKGGHPGTTGTFAPMTISPVSNVVSVGTKTTVSVTYRDSRGAIIPETTFRWTYYGCLPVAPALATCNDLLSLLPVSPYLRQAEIQTFAPGQVRLYASDGLGTYVWADLTIQ
jgi:hypothetical protein